MFVLMSRIENSTMYLFEKKRRYQKRRYYQETQYNKNDWRLGHIFSQCWEQLSQIMTIEVEKNERNGKNYSYFNRNIWMAEKWYMIELEHERTNERTNGRTDEPYIHLHRENGKVTAWGMRARASLCRLPVFNMYIYIWPSLFQTNVIHSFLSISGGKKYGIECHYIVSIDESKVNRFVSCSCSQFRFRIFFPSKLVNHYWVFGCVSAMKFSSDTKSVQLLKLRDILLVERTVYYIRQAFHLLLLLLLLLLYLCHIAF